MKYQIGEVVRFAETPNNETANLVGKLATITNYGGVEREWYQTAVTGNRWFPPGEFEPVNGGMKPAGESASDTPLTYQLGEVIRFADTPSNREKQLCGKLATLISVDHGDPETYQTARTADEWFYAGAFESVNGGMPKPEEESVSDSADNETDFVTVTRLISGLDSCDYDCLIDWLRDETDRRNNAEHDTLLVDLGVALNRCLDSKLFSFLEQESLNELSKIYENDLDPSVRE